MIGSDTSPEVAVTVSMYVPGGVPGFPPPPPPPPPPQATNNIASASVALKTSPERRRVAAESAVSVVSRRSHINSCGAPPSSHSPNGGEPGRRLRKDRECAVVVTDTVVVAVFVPLRVTEGGFALQVACDGAPVQANETDWLKPPDGVTVRVKFSIAPL